IDADQRLSPKTCFDYRHYTDFYVRPLLGDRRVRDVGPEVLIAWQRQLAQGGGRQGAPLAPNTIRLRPVSTGCPGTDRPTGWGARRKRPAEAPTRPGDTLWT
ncbi:MAG: hypothetical protein ACRD0J_15490, partial [Acidimicrobiales bacterium]